MIDQQRGESRDDEQGFGGFEKLSSVSRNDECKVSVGVLVAAAASQRGGERGRPASNETIRRGVGKTRTTSWRLLAGQLTRAAESSPLRLAARHEKES
jgi:hypothetical protein